MTTSSMAERPTVNRMVSGSSPEWSAVQSVKVALSTEDWGVPVGVESLAMEVLVKGSSEVKVLD